MKTIVLILLGVVSIFMYQNNMKASRITDIKKIQGYKFNATGNIKLKPLETSLEWTGE